MVRVKFCGMTNTEDCEKAVELGADYVGFVFYERSRRYVSPKAARAISRAMDGLIGKVGVFVEESDDQIREIMDFCALDLCQVYRNTTVEKSVTAFRIKDNLPEDLPPQGLILFDSYSSGFGGSGQSFDFRILRDAPFLDRSFIAGGIDGSNVTEVLRLAPYGIDLVSSIEERPGTKSHRKMAAFMTRVRDSEAPHSTS
jgi:phosphoribosylanthranilate isomerase